MQSAISLAYWTIYFSLVNQLHSVLLLQYNCWCLQMFYYILLNEMRRWIWWVSVENRTSLCSGSISFLSFSSYTLLFSLMLCPTKVVRSCTSIAGIHCMVATKAEHRWIKGTIFDKTRLHREYKLLRPMWTFAWFTQGANGKFGSVIVITRKPMSSTILVIFYLKEMYILI